MRKIESRALRDERGPAVSELEISDKDKQRVETVWNIVFRVSGKILHDAKIYGFDGIGDLPAPNIHDMVRHLKVYGAIIDILYNSAEDYEQQRQLLNARSQITNMERVAAAVVAGERADYEVALAALEKQCVI